MHLESLLYLRLSRLFHLNHHLKLRVIEAPLILTATFLQESLLNLVRIILRTFPKLKAIFRIIKSVAFPTGHALPPGGDLEATPTTDGAITALGLFVSNSIEIFLDVELLAPVVILEMQQGRHPPLLDELVVAGELPSHQLLRVPRSKIEILVHQGPPDILPLQHVPRLELNRKV